MEVLLNDQIPINSWDTLVRTSPYSTPFQTIEFYRLFNSVPGLSATAIAITNSGLLLALAVVTLQKEQGIKGYFSRRAIIYGGPLFNNDHPEGLELLLEQISIKIKGKAIYLESRNFSDYSSCKNVFYQFGFKYVPWLNFKLATEDLESMTKAASNSRIRQIRKAIKGGVTWGEARNHDEVMSFYEILSVLYRRKIGKPLFPLEFFKNFFDSGIGKYLLIWYNNKLIGGIMCPILKGKTIYELYVCGLDEDYKEQYPSVMATWAAMEYANQNNIPLFDFMGAGEPENQYGVREFKARFGGELIEYGRFLKINNHFLYNLGKLGLKVKRSFIK